MFLPELTDHIRRLFRMKNPDKPATTLPPAVDSVRRPEAPAENRPMTAEERAVAEWMLQNAQPPALEYLPQLDVARVTDRCSCGCPTIHLTVPADFSRGGRQGSPFADTSGYVDGNMVGLMFFQAGGHLTCLEVYDLSDIEHPYPLHPIATLEVLRWPDREKAE